MTTNAIDNASDNLAIQAGMAVEDLNGRVLYLEKQFERVLSLLLDSRGRNLKNMERIDQLEKQVELLTETIPKKNVSETTEPKKKRITGFILYSNAHREQVKDSLTNGIDKPRNSCVLKKLSQMWQLLSQDERNEWNAMALEVKARGSD